MFGNYGTSKTKNKKEPTYEVIQYCGKLSDDQKYNKELRIISWNGNEPKFDIRVWYDDNGNEKMQKGITLTSSEIETLYNILKEMEKNNAKEVDGI